MAMDGREVDILRARCARPLLHRLGRIQQLPRNADAGEPIANGRKRCGDAAAAATDIMRVHCRKQCHVAGRIESLDEPFTMQRQPLADEEFAIGVARATKAALETFWCAIAEHADHARERETVFNATNSYRALHDRAPHNALRRLCGRRGKHHRAAHALGKARGEFERDHAAQ